MGFQAKTIEEHGYIILSVTNNGYQWSSIRLRRKDVSTVVAALTYFLPQTKTKENQESNSVIKSGD